MKEFSIEQKAQRYDKAIIEFKPIYDLAKEQGRTTDVKEFERIFPELAESDDERIRKALIKYLDALDDDEIRYGVSFKDMRTWLEKQGKQNPTIEMKSPEESLGVDSDTYNKIVDECIYGEQNPAWSEEDEENLNWFEKFFRAESVIAEGRDVPQDRYLWFKNLKDRVQPQKQEWSEEDEKIIIQIKKALEDFFPTSETDKIKNWFKLLKYRIQPKQEWSMYDETILKAIIDHFEYKKEFNEAEDYDIVLWLKSLRPQSQWKPSDEQMEALWSATEKYLESNNENVRKLRGEVLESLFEDLKKLKV